MAHVRLTLGDADGRLPDVCMVCGEEATVLKKKTMSWCPPWVVVLVLVAWPIWLVVTLVLTKRATLQAPLCDAHQGHWFNRLMINLGTLLVCAVIGGGGFFALWALLDQGRPNDGPGLACLLPVVMLVTWIIVLVILQQSAIRPQEITDREIALTGVCDAFVDAVEEQQERRDAARRRRRRGDDDDYEDDPPPPKKKRPPSADIEELPPRPKKKRPADDAFEE